jgi:hypothetical protein
MGMRLRMTPFIFLLFVMLPAARATVITDPGQGVFTYTGSAPGLSGITWLGGNSYYAVSDSAGAPDIYPVTIALNANGTVSSASVGGAFALATGADPEGIAFHPARGTLFVSDEGSHPDGGYVREFNRFTGALVNSLTIPSVMLRDRPSLGFEALTLGAGSIWIANEQALEHESHTANSTEGSTVRLQRFNDSTLAPSGQWAYRTDPYHGAPDLVALPDGRLLVLERTSSFGSGSTWHNRIYLVDFSQATDTSAIADLDGASFTLTSKTLLWDADMGTQSTRNFEGIALGPQLDEDTYSLVLIADNGTGSTQHLYALTLHIPEPGVPALLLAVAAVGSVTRRSRRPCRAPSEKRGAVVECRATSGTLHE